ncbi:MAG: PKD domain-containing protein, partial [Patescibacteria group bacterium]
TNDGLTVNGHDVDGLAIIGTPKAANSGAQPQAAATTTEPDAETLTSIPSNQVSSGDSGVNLNPVSLKAEDGADVAAEIGQNIVFDGSASQGAVGYKWYLGDGAVKEGANVTHSFFYPGVYLVTLEASDSLQATAWDQSRVYIYGGKVLINEFKPGADGWLELYNPNNFTADLSAWILESAGRNFVLPAFVVIPPKSFLVLAKRVTGLDLAAADTVRLKYPNGAIVDEVKFERPPAAFDAAARGGGGFYWTKEATPGRSNIILSPVSSGVEGAAPFLNTLIVPQSAAVTASPQQAISNLVKSSYNEVTDPLASAASLADSYEAAMVKSGRWSGILGGLGFWVVLAVAVGVVIGVAYAVVSRRWRSNGHF